MNQQRSDVVRRLLIGITVCAVILVIGFFAVVSTRWGHGLDNDAYFGRDASGRVVVKLDGEILGHVRKATLLVLLAAIFLVAYVRKIPVIGGFAVAGVVCAVAGAEVLKRILPWHVLIESDSLLGRGLQTETYPSGHATIGSSLALAALMVSPARWRSWGSIAAGLVMAGFATGVVFSGWHRPSDAVAGVCWAGVVMGLTAVAGHHGANTRGLIGRQCRRAPKATSRFDNRQRNCRRHRLLVDSACSGLCQLGTARC
ncbi:MAG: phosphatase PAP2 family protein [Candidatus Nanopelagicales bacterium]